MQRCYHLGAWSGMRRELMRPVGFLAALLVLAASCGGSSAGDLAKSGGLDEGQVKGTARSAVTVLSAAVENSTTLPSTTSTTVTPPPFEEHLAAGLLTLDDLPDGYTATYSNGLVTDGTTIGNYGMRPCGVDVPEPPAVDARNSAFYFDTQVNGFPPEGVFDVVVVAIRQLEPNSGPGVVDLHDDAVTCATTEVFVDPDTVLVSPAIDVPEVDGVRATGIQWTFTTGQLVDRSILTYFFEIDDLDGQMFMSGVAPDLADLPDLARPIVEAFQRRLAACSTDRAGCSFEV